MVIAIVPSSLVGLLLELNELRYEKCMGQCLAYSKYDVSEPTLPVRWKMCVKRYATRRGPDQCEWVRDSFLEEVTTMLNPEGITS